jgi:hypothetical protein
MVQVQTTAATRWVLYLNPSYDGSLCRFQYVNEACTSASCTYRLVLTCTVYFVIGLWFDSQIERIVMRSFLSSFKLILSIFYLIWGLWTFLCRFWKKVWHGRKSNGLQQACGFGGQSTCLLEHNFFPSTRMIWRNRVDYSECHYIFVWLPCRISLDLNTWFRVHHVIGFSAICQLMAGCMQVVDTLNLWEN